jgi:hypothetical protein
MILIVGDGQVTQGIDLRIALPGRQRAHQSSFPHSGTPYLDALFSLVDSIHLLLE